VAPTGCCDAERNRSLSERAWMDCRI
jgi:hypothetical protein